MQWIQATNDKENLPKDYDTAPVKVNGVFDLGVCNFLEKRFVTQNHGPQPYRNILWLSQSTPAIPEDVGQAAKKWAKDNIPDELEDTAEMEYCVDAYIAGAAHGQQGDGNTDEWTQKHLDRIWGKLKEAKIELFIKPLFIGLKRASVEYFLEKGTVSGEFFLSLHNMMDSLRNWKADHAPLPSNIVEQLRLANPYNENWGGLSGTREYEAWVKSVSKLRELLLSQPVQGNEPENKYKLPGHDETMGNLDNLTIKPK